MIEKMLDAFNKIHPLSEALIDALISITEINDYPKKTVLLKEGQKATRAYFVLKGMARAFYVSGEKETTRLFMDEGYVITSWLSFYTGEPAHECIELLEDSTLAILPRSEINHLYATFPEFNVLGRKITEHFFYLSEERSVMLRKHTAEEKYHFFIKKYPMLFQRIAQKHIATYLGMKEETLSRIRAKMLKKTK